MSKFFPVSQKILSLCLTIFPCVKAKFPVFSLSGKRTKFPVFPVPWPPCPRMPCRSPGGGVVSQHALQVSRPTPGGEVEGSCLGGSPGPHPGESWGVWPGGSPGPHQGGLSRPTPRGVSQNALRQTPPRADGYCCRRYTSYWNVYLFDGPHTFLCVNHTGYQYAFLRFLAELFRGMLSKCKGENKKSHQKWDLIVNLRPWLAE